MNRTVTIFTTGFLAAVILLAVPSWWLRRKVGPSSRRKRVVVFGDSITQHGYNSAISGWVAGLGNWWTRRVDVLNRGFSGYNSRWAKLMVHDAVISEDPHLVFIFFGANDAVDHRVLQHVPLEEYQDNLDEMVRLMKKVKDGP
jgi:lysophospholipase L1-like esterase